MSDDPLARLERRVIAFSGNFGSGKSEVSVNVAFHLAGLGEKVAIVDLDVVNPYFRCREARQELEAAGVEVIAPSGDQKDADLPIILPEIRGRLRQFDGRVILDVGGDDLGARALSSLSDALTEIEHHFLLVLNERRPYTRDLETTVATMARIEASARLPITGVAGNTHLMDGTTAETIRTGHALAREVADARKLPLLFVTAPAKLLEEEGDLGLDCPVLPLRRKLRPPWMTGSTGPGGSARPRPGRPWGAAPDVRLPE